LEGISATPTRRLLKIGNPLIKMPVKDATEEFFSLLFGEPWGGDGSEGKSAAGFSWGPLHI